MVSACRIHPPYEIVAQFFLSCACTLLLYVYNVSPVSMSLFTVHASDVVKCKIAFVPGTLHCSVHRFLVTLVVILVALCTHC